MTIYFLMSEDESLEFVKVGHSNNPERRVHDINTASPYPLYIAGEVAGTKADEKRLHQFLAPFRHRLEWYREEVFDMLEHIDLARCTILKERGLKFPDIETAYEAVDAVPLDEALDLIQKRGWFP